MCSGTPGWRNSGTHAAIDAGGEVLGQLDAHRRVDDEPGRGDRLLGLAADVGGVPGRPSGAEPDQDGLDRGVAVERHPPAGRRGPSAGPAAAVGSR